MKVRIKRGFVDGRHGVHSEGDEVELPAGVDWVQAGLAEPVKEKKGWFTKKAGGAGDAPYAIKEMSPGWYDVIGPEGAVNDKRLRQKDAEQMAAEMNEKA